jgi:hypothetical protein
VPIDVEDMGFMEDGSGRVIIRHSKTYQSGEGSLAYLSPDSVRYLQAWLAAAQITHEAMFRRLIGRGELAIDCSWMRLRRPSSGWRNLPA